MMNALIESLMEQAMELVDPYAVEGEFGPRRLNAEKFADLIVQDCANFVRESYDHADAEGIAWYMEIKYGLHGDYA